ncbi:hypothetical protein N9030_01230 [bacterium]|nr:hypothetical protein [bacterium]
MPGDQVTFIDTPVAFTDYLENQISTTDTETSNLEMGMRLEATDGVITLVERDPWFAAVTYIVGDGLNDQVIQVTAQLEYLNEILSWTAFTPAVGFEGQATFTITVEDFGNHDGTESLNDTDTILIDVIPREKTFNPSPTRNTAPGILDDSFDGDGVRIYDFGQPGGLDRISTMEVLDDGKILATGSVDGMISMMRFTSDLELDPSFGGGDGIVQTNVEATTQTNDDDAGSSIRQPRDGSVFRSQVDDRGMIYLGGNRTLFKFDSEGALDSTFGNGTGSVTFPDNPFSSLDDPFFFQDIATMANGDLIAGFSSYAYSRGSTPNEWGGLWRMERDGSNLSLLDQRDVFAINAFDDGYYVTVDERSNTETWSYDSRPDRNFNGGSGDTGSVLKLHDRKFLVTGWAGGDLSVARHLSTGELDTNFGQSGFVRVPVLNSNDQAFRSVITHDGKILVVGTTSNGSDTDIAVARLTYDGVPDTTFTTYEDPTVSFPISPGTSDVGRVIVQTPDLKTVIAGEMNGLPFIARVMGDAEALYAPTIDPIDDIRFSYAEEVTIDLSGITAGGADDQPISIVASVSNENLVQNLSVDYTSADTTGLLRFNPSADTTIKFATISLTVMDGGMDGDLETIEDNDFAFESFKVFLNELPTLDAIETVTAVKNSVDNTVDLTGITAGLGESQNLQLSVETDSPELFSNLRIAYNSPQSTGTLFFTPTEFMVGSGLVTITVEDSGVDNSFFTESDNGTISQTFRIEILASVMPTIDPLDDLLIEEDSGTKTVSLTGITAGPGESQELVVSVSSSNEDLIATPTLNYTSPNGNGTLTFFPVANLSGSAVITVTVEDGGEDNDLNTPADNLFVTETFSIIVEAVNDAPTLNPLSDLAVAESANEQVIVLTGITAGGGENHSIRLVASSDNTNLIPNPTVTYTSPDSEGVLRFKPADASNGEAIITVMVEDAGLDGNFATPGDNQTTSRTFQVTVGSGIEDLGRVDYHLLANSNVNAEKWYKGIAHRDGTLTFEANFDVANGAIAIELLDSNKQLVSSGSATSAGMRIDQSVLEGELYFFRIIGTNASTDLRISNLISVNNDAVDVFGTIDYDKFVFAAGDRHRVVVKDVEYFFNAQQYSTFVFDGSFDYDSIWIGGSTSDEIVDFRVSNTRILGDGFNLEAQRINNVVFKGKGGSDVANFFDSAGSDTFNSSPGLAIMNGANYEAVARDVPVINAIASSGNDYAFLRDSNGDDVFEATPFGAVMNTGSMTANVSGFKGVYGLSSGGTDSALMYDSDGADQVISWSDRMIVSGTAYRNTAIGFEVNSAYSSGQSDDVGIVYDSDGSDVFYAWGHTSTMQQADRVSHLYNYEKVFASATNGNDEAVFYDSSGNDVLVAYSDRASLTQPGKFTWVSSFDSTTAYSSEGGMDQAILFDSAGNDRYIGTPSESQLFYGDELTPSYQTYGFARTYAESLLGQDTAKIYDSEAHEIFASSTMRSGMVGDEMFIWASGFGQVDGYSQGGSDIAKFYDSLGDDVYISESVNSEMMGLGYHNRAFGFLRSFAFSSGGNDVAHMYDTVFDDLYRADSNRAVMRNVGGDQLVINTAENFPLTYGYSREGLDRARLFDSSGNDVYSNSGLSVTFSGNDFENRTEAFAYNEAYSLSGDDRAILEDSTDDDELLVRTEGAKLKYGSGEYFDVRSFDEVFANSLNGGDDNVIYSSPFDYDLNLNGDWDS